MEGDAGASRLNPPPMPIFRRLRRRRPKNQQEPTVAGDQTSPLTAEASAESADASDETRPAETVEDSAEPGDEPDETDETGDEAAAAESVESDAPTDAGDAALERGGSRLGRGWLIGIAAALVLCAGDRLAGDRHAHVPPCTGRRLGRGRTRLLGPCTGNAQEGHRCR